ncbi:MAG: phosphoglycerate mutase [Proteobacteria bacterium]|nr:phosphoglycerate mutase [Pseudomonadota bacterium]
MSPTPHLLIPLAASHAEGCRQALHGLALPQLDRLLARLTPADQDVGSEAGFTPPHERALARHLGLPADAPPWAAWQRQQTDPQDAQASAWAFISPCQWQAGANHVLLADPALLQLTEQESRALLAILAPWLAEDGITLIYDQPTRWLARGAPFAGLATASLQRVTGRDVSPWLPDKQQARALHRLHSEMQMLLYTHPFNDARAAQGLPPVNAFWVHGAGALPQAPATSAEPEMPTALLDAALREDWQAWAAAWQALDAGPVARLAAHVAKGGSARLTLCGERSAMAWDTAPRGLGQRIQSFLSPQRFTSLREQL